MRIGFDIDGVLADFMLAYSTLGNKMFGTPIVKDVDEDSKEYGIRSHLGISPEQDDEIWKEIDSTANFWERLEPSVEPVTFQSINFLAHYHEVYFITSRNPTAGQSTQIQTAKWLRKYGIFHPSVVISHHKDAVCRAMHIDFMIDDKLSTVINILKTKYTKAWVIDRAHNRGPVSVGVPRVHTVDEYIQKLTYDYFTQCGIDPYHGEK